MNDCLEVSLHLAFTLHLVRLSRCMQISIWLFFLFLVVVVIGELMFPVDCRVGKVYAEKYSIVEINLQFDVPQLPNDSRLISRIYIFVELEWQSRRRRRRDVEN